MKTHIIKEALISHRTFNLWLNNDKLGCQPRVPVDLVDVNVSCMENQSARAQAFVLKVMSCFRQIMYNLQLCLKSKYMATSTWPGLGVGPPANWKKHVKCFGPLGSLGKRSKVKSILQKYIMWAAALNILGVLQTSTIHIFYVYFYVSSTGLHVSSATCAKLPK